VIASFPVWPRAAGVVGATAAGEQRRQCDGVAAVEDELVGGIAAAGARGQVGEDCAAGGVVDAVHRQADVGFLSAGPALSRQ
jgi:hypothetical protein